MKTFFDSLRRINNNWFALVGVGLIVCSLNAQNAYALANGQRGFADLNGNSNWWEWFVNEPETPCSGKSLDLTLYLTDPISKFY